MMNMTNVTTLTLGNTLGEMLTRYGQYLQGVVVVDGLGNILYDGLVEEAPADMQSTVCVGVDHRLEGYSKWMMVI